jgi:hypothetical protein
MNNYALVCRFTGEVLKDFPFQYLRDNYVRDHKLAGVAYGPMDLSLKPTSYDVFKMNYLVTQSKVAYYTGKSSTILSKEASGCPVQ